MLRYLLRRGRPLILLTAVGLAALGLNSVPSQAALDNSTFESADGNLVLDAIGNKDWVNAPNLAVKRDKSIKLKEIDDFYQGGPKHDNPCPAVKKASAGLPAAKDDLLEFYVSHDTVGTDNFLYLAWERFLDKDSTASAHMDFEFNQKRSRSCSNNDVNVDRTAGDIMITFDLTGGGTPRFHLLRWLTSLGPGDDCEAAASAPCWGNSQDLTGNAEGAVNSSAPIFDPVADPDRTLNFKNQFGEAAINLTRSGVFTPGTCAHFGNALLASRSSGSSFNSGLDDFVGPLDVDIQNCGSIKIQKTDDAGHALPNITFTAFLDVDPNDGAEAPTTEDLAQSRGQCTSSDGTGEGIAAGECTIEGLFQGFYWVMEDAGDVPDGYASVGPIRVEVQAGVTLTLPVENPRKHRVIVIVCHEGDNTLFPSEVVRGTESHDSLSDVPAALMGKVTEAQLCKLGGAQFNSLGHADLTFTAKLAGHE